MKIKHNENKNTFSIKGLDATHLDLIYEILQNVRLGTGFYQERALELLNMFSCADNTGGPSFTVLFTQKDGLCVIELLDELESDNETGIRPGQFVEVDTPSCGGCCTSCNE